ncbi:MAG: DNA recombination protein RmuC, partial [Alphaproteobacteria bacterium]|nr:DNA recombination protein RmuC [Alphaproteobacteria bacterium]
MRRGRGSKVTQEAAQEVAQRTANLEHGLSTLYASQNELNGRLDQLTQGLEMSHTYLSQLLEERLGAVHQTLGQNLSEQSQKTQESLGTLATRLAVIDEAQKNIIELSGQVVSLQEVLANRHTRGAFGEIQLEGIVKNALPPNAYRLQATLASGKRVDCLVNMPNPPGPIAIDAKFPLESYRAMREAGDDTARQAAQRQFRADVLAHIKAICERYIAPGETADSAIMFLPSEAVYAELHASFPDVIEEGFRKRVWIVSPTTLMATLNTVRAILKDAQMREQAHVIQTEVTRMTDDVRRLGERVGKLKKHFGLTEADIDEVLKSTEAIAKRIVKIEGVQLGEVPAPREAVTQPPARPAAATPAAA